MKKLLLLLLAFSAIHCSVTYKLSANWGETVTRTPNAAESQKTFRTEKNGYVLHVDVNSPGFSDSMVVRLITTFFKVYPNMVNTYNPASAKEVFFSIDTAYTGVAEALGNKITYNPTWFVKYPEDIDVVTHEAMHVVQNYGNTNAPWWLTEGIADYVRHTMGVNNEAAKWSLPALQATHHYSNGYRVTARFLAWVEANVKSGFVRAADKSIREGSFTDAFWKNLTGKTADDLWKDYQVNPAM